MKILILTPIPLEYNEVRKFLASNSIVSIQNSGSNYENGQFIGLYHNFEIFLSQTGSNNNNVALATEKMIQHFSPDIVILTGIAGGVKDVKIGDVVIANKLYGYESGKETANGFVARPEVIFSSSDLLSHAEHVARNNDWKSRSSFADSSNVFIGPIASGDKVIASTDSVVYDRLKLHYNDTLALEMEAIGFGKVMLHHPLVKFINIRGVSDLLDGKSETDSEGGQHKAIANVVAFVFEMIYQLNYSKLNLPKEIMEMKNMDVKTIAKEVVSFLFPLLKMNSIQEIGKELKEATDTSIQETWKKISPIFIEEFQAEIDAGEDITSEETQESIKTSLETKLRRTISRDETLAEELRSFLANHQDSVKKEVTNSTQNSKNTIQGSSIKAGGNAEIGDKTTNHIGQQVNNSGAKIGRQINIKK